MRRRASLVLCALALAVPLGTAAARADDPEARTLGEKLPRLMRTSARQAQADWTAVKALGNIGSQLEAIARKRLPQKSCDDLVDLRALADQQILRGFSFRDNVRGRSWARPTMALLLVEAMKRFQREHPGRVIAIGDVSQPGCGQLEHGVLVKEVNGQGAARLLAQARLVLGEPALVEVKSARDFPWEADRFGPPTERVLVTTRLVARDGQGDSTTLRIARTRHREQAAPSEDEVRAFESQLARIMKGKRARSRAVESDDAAGGRTRLWLTHWIAPAPGEQAIVVTREKPGRRLDWRDVVEVRVSRWQDKKPGSFPDEVRWVVESVATATPPDSGKKATRRKPAPTPIGAVRFSRWALLYEAGHISHLSGIDADLSYVTVGDTRHFAVDPEVFDAAATWRWLEILEATARELGTPVDAILVDAKIKRLLQERLPKKGPGSLAAAKKGRAWRLLTLVGGHDAHHHLRIVEATDKKEREARRRLLGAP